MSSSSDSVVDRFREALREAVRLSTTDGLVGTVGAIHACFQEAKEYLDDGVPWSNEDQEKAGYASLDPRALASHFGEAVDPLFALFERQVAGVDSARLPTLRSYLQRCLHGVLLLSPFADRAFRKPLGFAGDHEVVRMMFGDTRCAGSTLLGRMISAWLLNQPAVLEHRNRVAKLTELLMEE